MASHRQASTARAERLRRNRLRREQERREQVRNQPWPLEVCIATSPGSIGRSLSLKQDIDRVRSALLYADHIELISPGAVMLASVMQLGVASESELLDLMVGLSAAGVLNAGGGTDLDPESRDQVAAIAALLRLPAGLNGDVDNALEQVREMLTPGLAPIREVAVQMFEGSGLEELIPALDCGLVELSRSGMTDDMDPSESVEQYAEIIKKRLLNPRKRLLLDETVHSLVTAMVNEGHVNLPSARLRTVGEGEIGSGLISRLPAFPQASTDELLELRSELQHPLTRYRAAVAGMAKETAVGSALITQDDVDQLWLERVAPALADLREEFSEHSFVREVARTVGRDIGTVVSFGSGGVLWMGLEHANSLNAWLHAAAAAAVPATRIVAASRAAQAEARSNAGRHELFFLYEVDQRLS